MSVVENPYPRCAGTHREPPRLESFERPLQPPRPESQTPTSLLDADVWSFLASLGVHLLLIVGLGSLPIWPDDEPSSLTLVLPDMEELEEEELLLPEEFYMAERPVEEIGANSMSDTKMALSAGEVLSQISEIASPADVRPVDIAPIATNLAIERSTALHIENLPVRGAAGEGETGAEGAIDRITQEILLSLEERPTLVVWLFDQSGSLLRQRKQIYDRLDRIYDELGVIEAAENPAFKQHSKKPLLTSVVAFGETVNFMIDKPTDNIAEIKEAVQRVPLDRSGVERVFTAVHMSAERYRRYRRRSPHRNVMLVVFTDEAGEDQNGVDTTVDLCRRLEMPVYVVGVPAPFGRQETLVKWVDPDPNYDQSPQWGRVDQGPESLVPERIRLSFFDGSDLDPMDSGFGPYALTRLAYETGGIYFAVHPNRNINRQVRRGETAAFASHLKHFFDPERMRPYRPDYVSTSEYLRQVKRNGARAALVRAAQLSWIEQMETPRLRFVRRSEAGFVAELTEAQKVAARLEPQLAILYETLRQGEEAREEEVSLRWQASYDLAMGRVLAANVRTQAYNAMLAAAKRELKFENPKNNTWTLQPADEISVGSKLKNAAEQARSFLDRVRREHPGTPWSLLAERELRTPMGWKWTESYTNLTPPRRGRPGNNNNNRPRPPRDDEARMLNAPPPKRPPPKL